MENIENIYQLIAVLATLVIGFVSKIALDNKKNKKLKKDLTSSIDTKQSQQIQEIKNELTDINKKLSDIEQKNKTIGTQITALTDETENNRFINRIHILINKSVDDTVDKYYINNRTFKNYLDNTKRYLSEFFINIVISGFDYFDIDKLISSYTYTYDKMKSGIKLKSLNLDSTKQFKDNMELTLLSDVKTTKIIQLYSIINTKVNGVRLNEYQKFIEQFVIYIAINSCLIYNSNKKK